MTEDKCRAVKHVSQAECKDYRESFSCELDSYDERLNKKDVADARAGGVAEIQTKLLWGIFGVLLVGYVTNYIAPLL